MKKVSDAKKPKKRKVKTEKEKLQDECDKLWSKCVIKRDGTCRFNNSDIKLSAHHIRSRRHMATRWLLDNGLTLSWPVHSLQKLNPELFHDRIIEIIGQDEYDRLKDISNGIVKHSIQDLKDIKQHLSLELKREKHSIARGLWG